MEFDVTYYSQKLWDVLKGQKTLTPELKRAKAKVRRDLGIPDYSFYFRSDVLATAKYHNLTLKETALLALIHDKTHRPDDFKELEKTRQTLEKLGVDLNTACKKYEEAVNAWTIAPCKTDRFGNEIPMPKKRKFNIPHLEHTAKEYKSKLDSIQFRIDRGAWFDSPKNRTRFCETVEVKTRQFQKIKRKLLDKGLIAENTLIMAATGSTAMAYVSNVPRNESFGTHYTVLSDYKIFGYFSLDVFPNMNVTLLDKCYLNIIYALMLAQSDAPQSKADGEIDPAYVRKGSSRKKMHDACRKDPTLVNAYDEDWGNVYIGSRHLCDVLRCSPSTLTALRKKWAHVITQVRRHRQTSRSYFLFDKKRMISEYRNDEKYFDEFFNHMDKPNFELFARLDSILNAENADKLEAQNKVIAPEIIEEYYRLEEDDKIEHFKNCAAQDTPAAQKLQRWTDLSNMIIEACRHLNTSLHYRTVNVWQSYLKRHPQKDPNYHIILKQQQEQRQQLWERYVTLNKQYQKDMASGDFYAMAYWRDGAPQEDKYLLENPPPVPIF